MVLGDFLAKGSLLGELRAVLVSISFYEFGSSGAPALIAHLGYPASGPKPSQKH
jgi:hypothetical protein